MFGLGWAMRIAQIAPLYEAVPPLLYGGTERVVHYLTEELVALGHDVTLFASADSRSSAKLHAACPTALRLDPHCRDRTTPHVMMLEQVMQCADAFDILHFHTDIQHFPLARRCPTPSLTTLHGRLDLKELAPVFAEFHDLPLVSISDSQRRPAEDAWWVGTVYHGLPVDGLRPIASPAQNYLAFLGRASHEKRLDRAIKIARLAGLPLKIAAKADPQEQEDFDQIKPLLNDPLIEWVGEIGEDRKSEFLSNALALLFPIDWPEPFGLVMIEAMACGTPVIAWPCGSVPEVIDHGKTGFIVSNTAQAVSALGEALHMDRRRIRTIFEERFSARRMAHDYLALYHQAIKAKGGLAQYGSDHILNLTGSA